VTDLMREQATPQGHLGTLRYRRYVAAFDRVIHCIDTGYYLEAIAILDSLICDRLFSRLSYNYGGQELKSPPRSCGEFCKRLLHGDKNTFGKESDPGFQEVIKVLQEWASKRNDAMHGTAKILHSNGDQRDFGTVLELHRENAREGVELLQRFDILDTEDRQRNRVQLPATAPNAFFPEKRVGIPLNERRTWY
jgi:hypothetical protein